MRIIDRYLLRQFLQTFVICFVSLTGLCIVFDAFTHLDDFLRCAERGRGLLALMGTHYAYQSLFFFDRTSGLLALTSAMFTVTWIQRHNEMTALMSAGIPRIRVVAPLIFAVIAISLLTAANRELVLPRFRNELVRQPTDPLGDVGQDFQQQYDNDTDILFRGKATFAAQQRIEKPDFLLPATLGQFAKQLAAANAYYRPPRTDWPGGYLFEGMEQPKDLATRPSLMVEGMPVVITPRDAPDRLKANQCFVVSNVTFDLLTGGRAFRQFASTPELIAGLRNRSNSFGADVRVAIHGRILNPLLDITLLFLGLPLVLTRESRNVFLAIGMCLVVVSIFLGVAIGCQSLGAQSMLLSPALAAWLPLILFVPGAVAAAQGMWE